jgi:lantibiotic modifying enzyme
MRCDGGPFLDVAAALARRITDSAIWFGGRCNWMGAFAGDASRPSGDHAAYAALGPDLYAGTSGVALFLAEAAVALDDDRMRATAVGATRHALEHADRVDPKARDGLYAGSIGIAYAAARVAHLLGDEVALTGARDVLRAWRRDRVPSAASDVMSGCAGAVAGLVALADLVEDSWLVEAAAGLGRDLIARARMTPAGWSWPAPGERSMHDLCGYSHGAAGIGHALCELFGATGDVRFRQAGERGFDYERSWFDERTQTWPDLRGVGRRASSDAPVPAAGSWCHGVPGIALSRVRAAQLLGPGSDWHDAGIAVGATRELVSELVSHAPEDFSLCHGAGGVADVLLYCEDVRGGASDDPSGLAAEVGLLGIERYHGSEASFPCGVSQGQTPGLFLGLSGIGLFYLRLAAPGVPTPLLIHRREALDTSPGATYSRKLPHH